MDLKFVELEKVDTDLWDRWVGEINEASFIHSAYMLKYYHRMLPPEKRLTFAVIENENKPLALCPLGISKTTIAGQEFYEASWNGYALGQPVFRDMSPSLRRNVQGEVFDYYHQIVREHDGLKCNVNGFPITLAVMKGELSLNSYSIMREGYECHPQNLMIVDLALSEEELKLRMSKYQRKHIKRSIKDGLVVVEYTGPSAGLNEMYAKYQEAHFISAGRKTRPQETFDLMLKYAEDGTATLFVAFAGDIPISFLFCGEFHGFTFGWSQVNVEEYEQEYSPRHFLEWQAMLAYKKRGFRFYTLGTRWYGPQPYKVPTAKEVSIAVFKERYGGCMFPDLYFEKIFDKDLWLLVHEQRLQEFLASDYFAQPEDARV